jgi:protein-tyrosine-phosphatase
MTPRPVRFLLVCLGKTWRSPLAASGASTLLGSRLQIERFGIDLTSHRSQHLREVALDQFNVLIALDPIVSAPRRAPCPVPPPPMLLWPRDDPSREGLDASRQCLAQLQATIAAHALPFLEV